MKATYRIYFIFVIFLVLTVSCIEKRSELRKLVYFTGQNLIYDSLNEPHLSIRRYLEYSKGMDIKIANGQFYNDSIAPAFGLNKFFKLSTSHEMEEILNKALINKNFDSTYFANDSLPWYSYILFETSVNKTFIIGFNSDALPPDLKGLCAYIETLIFSNDRKQIDPYNVDNMVVDLEKDLFSAHPPPPRIILDSLKEVKYIAPK
jgi:hypothetical protein